MPERQRPRAVFLFPLQGGDEAAWRPPVDVYQTHDGWLLKFDVAGVRPEDVTIRIADCRITVQGLRRDLLLEEGYFHYSMEISYSRFERTVVIPCSVQEGYRVEFRDGYLLVRLYTTGTEFDRADGEVKDRQ